MAIEVMPLAGTRATGARLVPVTPPTSAPPSGRRRGRKADEHLRCHRLVGSFAARAAAPTSPASGRLPLPDRIVPAGVVCVLHKRVAWCDILRGCPPGPRGIPEYARQRRHLPHRTRSRRPHHDDADPRQAPVRGPEAEAGELQSGLPRSLPRPRTGPAGKHASPAGQQHSPFRRLRARRARPGQHPTGCTHAHVATSPQGPRKQVRRSS